MEVLGNPDASTDVWYDEQDRPIFVSGASRHWFGQYDDRGLLAKVIAMNADFRVTRITAYEHADRYQAAVIYYCEGDGTCQRVALNSALDAQGQPLEFEKSATAAYSKRFESITEPMRYGLLPYYPIPGGQ
jgi:hypothetical protein